MTTGSGDDARANARPVALVTGATRGIGRAIADVLGPTHHVIVGGRDNDAVQSVVESLPSAQPWVVDLADDAGTTAAVAVLGLDRLDVLVHSAAVYAGGRVDEFDRSAWRKAFEVNVFAVADLTRQLLPALRTAHGRIIMLNAGLGWHSAPEAAVYSASKFALRSLSDALREEERASGVSVISIHPGRTDTDMQQELVAHEGNDYTASRYMRPETIAQTVAFAATLPRDAVIENLSIRPPG